MIPLGGGNGLFIRQLQPDKIVDNKLICFDSSEKFSWEYIGIGLVKLKSGTAGSILACYEAFKTANQIVAA